MATSPSQRLMVVSNLGTFALTTLASIGFYVADVVGARAEAKTSAKVEIVRIEAERDQYATRMEHQRQQLDRLSAQHAADSKTMGQSFKVSYDALLAVCLERCN